MLTLAEYWESLDRATQFKYEPKDRREQDLVAIHVRFQQDEIFRAQACRRVIDRLNWLSFRVGRISLESISAGTHHRFADDTVYNETESLLKLTYMRLLIDAFLMENGITHAEVVKMRREHPLPITGKDGSHDYAVLLKSYPALATFQPADDVSFEELHAGLSLVARTEYESYGSDIYQRRIESNYCERDFKDFYLAFQETGREYQYPGADSEVVVVAPEHDERPLITDEIIAVVEQQIREWGPVPALLWACSRILPLEGAENSNALMRAFTGITDYTNKDFNTYLITADRKLRLLDKAIRKEEFEDLEELKEETL